MAAEVRTVRLIEPVLFVDKITEKRHRRTIGHDFRVLIRVNDIRNCRLQWWEKTALPYEQGMQPNVWCDMFVLCPRSDVFERWNFETAQVPLGEVELEMRDRPGIMVDDTPARELSFEIRVFEENMYGECKMRRIKAREVLRAQPVFHQFIILENDFECPVFTGAPAW